MKYEIWRKSNWGNYSKNKPEDVVFTLDTAIKKAEELSKKLGNYDHQIYNWKTGQNEVCSVPNIVLVVERGGKTTRIRGIGSGGKFIYSRECKRCQNTGEDVQNWGLLCKACGSASFGWKKP